MNSSVIDGKFRLQLNRSVRGIEQAMDFSAGQTDGLSARGKICDQSNDLNGSKWIRYRRFLLEQNGWL